MIGTLSYRQRRSGVILVVVVSLLALFAVVGLGYVIYAETAATASRLQRDSQVVVDDRAHIEPELILNRVLGALIYDHPDDVTGVYSALRGHSLARSMYGQRELFSIYTDPVTGVQKQVIDPITKAPIAINTNTVPYSGTGIVKVSEPAGIVPGIARPLSGLPRDQIINYTYFNRLNPMERDPIIRVPEHYPVDPNNQKSYWKDLSTLNSENNRYFGGANAPYTYPDTNNVYLAALRASDGQVLIPSFHRPYLFLGPTGNTDATFLTNTTHPDWFKPSGRLKLLRPRPIDQVKLSDPRQQQIWQSNGNPPFPPQENISSTQLTQYSNATNALIRAGLIIPYPTDMGGDVKNLLGASGGNDSIWIDTGLPVRLTRSGKKFKPLVSFLILDLDGRVNLNIHGNLRGQPGGTTAGVHLHASNQGIGRWEVNPMHVLTIAGGEYQNLFQGNNGIPGRYTNGVTPTYPRPTITIGTQQVDLSSYGSSFLNPPNTYDAVTTTVYQIGATPAQGRTQLSTTISFPNPQYEPSYFRVDVDGANELLSRARTDMPYARAYNPATFQTQPLLLSSFPDYYTNSLGVQGAGYGNESAYPVVLPVDTTSEQYQSALNFNPLRNTGNSRQLDAMETHNMLARYNSPLDVSDSLLSRLLPQNLTSNSATAAAIRHRITLVSADVGRAGLTPQTFQRTAGAPSAWGIPTTPPPTALTIPFAQQGEQFPPIGSVPFPGTTTPPSPSDFAGNNIYVFAPGQQAPVQPNPGGSVALVIDSMSNKPISTFDGRAGIADFAGRVDLNRPLPPYPPLNVTGTNLTYSSPPATLLQQIQSAEKARAEFAKEIFERLSASVGAPPMTPAPMPGTPEYAALQYLAQLAVNIVDDIDEDDVVTVFRWNPNSTSPQATDWVYGVEMPKVLINEAYFEQTNGPTGDNQYVKPAVPGPVPPAEPAKALKYQINVWAELHHTMTPPHTNINNPDPLDKYNQFRNRHAVWLNNNVVNPMTGAPSPSSTYRMYLIKDTAQAPTVGDAQPGSSPDMGGMEKKTTFDSATKKALYPIDTRVGPAGSPSAYRSENGKDDTGFYVVGPDLMNPQTPATTSLGSQAATHKTNMMSYDERLEDTVPTPQPPQIVLQRLANPYLPAQPDLAQFVSGAQLYYNPYITVDVMKATPTAGAMPAQTPLNPPNGPINKQIMYNKDGNAGGGGGATKKSVMRRQPFAGAFEHLVMSDMMQPAGDDHSMFRHNGRPEDATGLMQLPESGSPGLERFDWYVHHDRKLVSPMELIHVAAVAPWDVTKNFIRNDTVTAGQKIRQGHTAPWFDQREQYDVTPVTTNPMAPYTGRKVDLAAAGPPTPGTPSQKPSTRLYRALEQFRVGDRTIEMAFGGRELGKININTIWDKEVFNALCDAYSSTSLDSKRGFTQADVDYVWAALTNNQTNLTARTPLLSQTGATPYSQITGQDKPFLGMGAPHAYSAISGTPGIQYPATQTGLSNPNPEFFQNAGLDATLFRGIISPDPAMPIFNRKMIFDAESQTSNQISGQASSDPTVGRMTHPMLEKSLLSKIFEHVTTRSNVFAVYMTVGYFEVTDDTQKPELLGDEIGILRDSLNGSIVENKAIRHRMFAIVDRTNLSLQPPRFQTNAYVNEDVQKQGPAPFYYTVPVRKSPPGPTPATPITWITEIPITSFQGNVNNAISVTGAYNGISWQLKPFDVVYMGSGQEQRRLVARQIQVIQNVAADGVTPILTASIQMAVPPVSGAGNWPNMDDPPPHPLLITNVIAGHPGPQPDFDHRMPNYRGVVLYSVIMD